MWGFFFHGKDWIHWVARSCTTTAYGWLSLDSHPSLRTSWSAVIKSPNFSARGRASPVCLLQRAFVTFGSQAYVAISVFRKMRINTDLLQIVQEVPSLFSENCVRVQAIPPPDFSWNSVNQSGISAYGSSKFFLSSLCLFWFWVFRDSCQSLLVANSSLQSITKSEDELEAALFPEARSASFLNDSWVSDVRTNCFQNWRITMERQEVRNCPSCRFLSFHLWSIVAFDRWPTHRSIRGLHRACFATRQQASPWVVAWWRPDSSHKRTPVPPRECALLH